MMELVEMVFAEMSIALGYEAWYESESEWEDMAEVMISMMGLDEEVVTVFFSDMAYDL